MTAHREDSMSDLIGAYKPMTPLKTAGSGSARWCIAAYGLERYFLKQFLSPVYPMDETSDLGRKQLERCRRFEAQKRRLYAALSCVIGETLVPVLDFFRFDRRYYAVSEAISPSHISAEDAHTLPQDDKQRLLWELALCLQRLHMQGVVHADLKPEHVLLLPGAHGHARLIDLDSGFLCADPPSDARQIEGDPVYLAPETFLRMTGHDALLTPALDTFAFGAMIHRIWTGELPAFDAARYTYLYEAALGGAGFHLSPALPKPMRDVVLGMLSAAPADRPTDAQIVQALSPAHTAPNRPSQTNGLSRFMKK